MTVPTTPDEHRPASDGTPAGTPLAADPAAPADVPDPVVATAPQTDAAPEDEADEVLDAPRAAPGFPPAPTGTPGTVMPPHRPI